MTIDEMRTSELNKALAYFVGLSYPLYKAKVISGKKWIVGGINHNVKMVTQDEIAAHYKAVRELICAELGGPKIEMQANSCGISTKAGFALLVDGSGYADYELQEMLHDLALRISNASWDIRTEFVKGCFDGRSSWDTTRHLLSIDVDRDYRKQNLIGKIIMDSLGIDVDKNQREPGYPKNDQLRIKTADIDLFLSKVGLYSVCRKRLIKR